MTDPVHEQLSALVDDELPQAERALLWQRLQNDQELAARWGRYHLIGDVLRGSVPGRSDGTLAGRVQAALARDTETPPSRVWALPRRWLKPLAGLAVAASVAAVALLAVRAPGPDAILPAVARTETINQNDFMRVEGTRWNVDKAQVANQLNGYLVNHTEYAGRNGVQGMLPYGRIVGYDSNQ